MFIKTKNIFMGTVITALMGSALPAGINDVDGDDDINVDYEKYDFIFKKAYDEKRFSEVESELVEIVRIMTKAALIGSTEEAKKYNKTSDSREEIDAVMLAGQNAAHGPDVPYMKQVYTIVDKVKKESLEIYKQVIPGLRGIRETYLKDNSPIKTVGHAINVVKTATNESEMILINAFGLSTDTEN